MTRTPKFVDLQLTWEQANWLMQTLEGLDNTPVCIPGSIYENLLEARDQAIEEQEETDAWLDSEEPDPYEMFADPGGRSALRAATPDNPRNQPCPNCGAENVLTPADVVLGYQCNRCADAAEGYGP